MLFLPRVPAWPGFMNPCGWRLCGAPWAPIPRFNVPMCPYLHTPRVRGEAVFTTGQRPEIAPNLDREI